VLSHPQQLTASHRLAPRTSSLNAPSAGVMNGAIWSDLLSVTKASSILKRNKIVDFITMLPIVSDA
jgi:hypothetical protein